MNRRIVKLGSLKSIHAFRRHLESLGCPLPCDDSIMRAPDSPLAAPLDLPSRAGPSLHAGNRFAIQPMEGWDAQPDGLPSELTRRRWRSFGRSGAGLVWGGEAVAVCPEARANPNQLLMSEHNAPALGSLREELLAAARGIDGGSAPVIGLQLTHSGRWSRPTSAGAAPLVAFRHPVLDRRVGVQSDAPMIPDSEIPALVGAFARAAHLAEEEGFDFVDLKHCHGYLLHEFLAARSRKGSYGGKDLSGRIRLAREIAEAVGHAAPNLALGVRLSVFDRVPHGPDGFDAAGRPGPGVPDAHELPYRHGFGLDPEDPSRSDLDEPLVLLRALAELGVTLVNVTAGSPYYVPHVQRPALFPPSDGYAPPEDPLVGVARLLAAARDVKRAAPDLIVVSSGWSYLQDYLPEVAQACLREGWFDAVGLGRMALSYPELPRDLLEHGRLERGRICRTFSDCTTAPRNGLISGCYPLDPFYRDRPERDLLDRLKKQGRRADA